MKKASKGTNSDLILSNNTVERKKSSNSQFTTHKSHSKLHSEDRTCLNQTPHSNVNSLAKLRPSGSIKEIAAKKLKSVIHYGSHEESYNSSKKQVCQDTHVIRVQKNLESKASTKSRNNQLRAIVSNKTNADAQSRNKLKNSNTVSNVSYHETPNKVNATPQTKNSKYLAYKRNPDLKSRNAPINGTSLTYKKIRNSKILCPEEVQKKDESRVSALMNKSPIEKYENVHHSNVKVAVKPNNFLYSNVKKDKFKGNELHPKMITVKTSNAAKAKRIFI